MCEEFVDGGDGHVDFGEGEEGDEVAAVGGGDDEDHKPPGAHD